MMQEIIAANQRRSIVLITLMLGMLVIMGVAIGEFVAPGGGGFFGLMAAIVIFAIQWYIYNFSPSSLVMQGMGGRRIEKAECPRLFNIVEEMQLASGLEKMPEIWLVDSASPNAFAYSDGRGNAAVAATTGLLWRLNRDELQGVMAHEVAHVVNKDVRFMTLAGVVLGSIVILAEMGRRMMIHGGRGASRTRSSGNAGGAQAVLLILLVVLAIAGPFLAQLLYFAISRKREYLADAAATVYTRYPEGLASALEKIQAHAEGLPGNTVAHAMCIVPPMAASSGDKESWSSTHPPTSKRIAILRSMGNSTGLAAYEEAVRKALGSGGMLPASAVAGAQRMEARAGTDEGPIMDRPGMRDHTQAAQGFRVINCACSMEIRVPPNYNQSTIRCIRCSTAHPVSSAKPLDRNPQGQAQPRKFGAPATFFPRIMCDCGHTVLVRPSAGTTVRCERCGASHSPSMARYGEEEPPPVVPMPAVTPGVWNRFPCPHCSAPIEVSPQFAASKIRCRGCGSMLQLS